MRILVVEDDAPLASFVKKGLEAEHYAVDVAGDGEEARLRAGESDYDLLILDLNLPNLSTPGYSRERPVLEESAPNVEGDIAYGTGVTLKGIESLRSRILDLQIGDETQQQSMSQSLVNTMNEVQTLFPMDTSGIGQQISTFFNSLNSLSTNPSDPSLRQSVLAAANGMTSAFNNVAGKLVEFRGNLDLNVQQDVTAVNQITQQIAVLNGKLSQVSSSGADYSSFLDQRNSLIQKLSGLIDVSALNDGTSLTSTTKRGAPLVVDGQSYTLATGLDADSNTQHVYSQGMDITGEIGGGEIGGLLQARDQVLTTLQSQLDSLASGLAQNLNSAHEAGFDLAGNPGAALFTVATGAGAAASLAVAISDPSLLAASADGTTGSNGNIANLSAVASQAVLNGMTPSQAYGNLVFQVGSAVNAGTVELNASTTILQQLQQQSSTVSGVSLDEEASNLLLYQRAYAAAARAISAVDEMLQTAIHLGANG